MPSYSQKISTVPKDVSTVDNWPRRLKSSNRMAVLRALRTVVRAKENIQIAPACVARSEVVWENSWDYLRVTRFPFQTAVASGARPAFALHRRSSKLRHGITSRQKLKAIKSLCVGAGIVRSGHCAVGGRE